MQAEAFKRFGGFPTPFKGYGAEDDAMTFLLYKHCGFPALLREIEVVHVSHPIGGADLQEEKENFRVLDLWLYSYGVKAFRLPQLFYPELDQTSPIVETL